MWQRLKPYGPTAGFWLFALAVTVSGVQSAPIAIVLAGLGVLCLLIPARPWLTHHLRSRQQTRDSSIEIAFGESDLYKVVNHSNGQRSDTVRVALRSKGTIFEPRFLINVLSPKMDEASAYVLIERIPRIIEGNDVPIAIARLDIIEGSPSDIMLQRVSPSGMLDPIRLEASDYRLQLSVSKNSAVLGEAYCRLWIDRGTLRLTPMHNY